MFKREFNVADAVKFTRLSAAPDSMLRLASLVALANEFLDFEYPRGDEPLAEAMDIENWRDGLKAVGVVGDALNAWIAEHAEEVRRAFVEQLQNEEAAAVIAIVLAQPKRKGIRDTRSNMWRWN